MADGPHRVAGPVGVRWATDTRGWALTLIPWLLVIAIQEASMLRVPVGELLGVILASSIAQALGAGLVTAVVAWIARRRWSVLPRPMLLAAWGTAGVARGFLGGFVAEQLTGQDPQLVPRILCSMLVAVTWIPLFTSTAARIEQRRELLAELATLRRQFAREDVRSRVSAGELSDAMLLTVRDRIGPILDDLRRTLTAVSGRSHPGALDVIGRRLSAVSADAETLLIVDTEAPECPALSTRPARASLAAALAVELRRPVRSSLLSGVALASALIPVVTTSELARNSLFSAIAVVAVVATLAATTVLRRHLRTSVRFAGGGWAIGSYLFSGLLGSASILLLDHDVPTRLDLTTIIVLPLAAVLSAGFVAMREGIGFANRELLTAVTKERDSISELRRRSAARDALVREQLAALTRGPLQGRLAACLMALNFHLGSRQRADPRSIATVTAAVIAHLAAASRDLDLIPSSPMSAGDTRP